MLPRSHRPAATGGRLPSGGHRTCRFSASASLVLLISLLSAWETAADGCDGCLNGGRLLMPNNIFGYCRCRCSADFKGPKCQFFAKRSETTPLDKFPSPGGDESQLKSGEGADAGGGGNQEGGFPRRLRGEGLEKFLFGEDDKFPRLPDADPSSAALSPEKKSRGGPEDKERIPYTVGGEEAAEGSEDGAPGWRNWFVAPRDPWWPDSEVVRPRDVRNEWGHRILRDPVRARENTRRYLRLQQAKRIQERINASG